MSDQPPVNPSHLPAVPAPNAPAVAAPADRDAHLPVVAVPPTGAPATADDLAAQRRRGRRQASTGHDVAAQPETGADDGHFIAGRRFRAPEEDFPQWEHIYKAVTERFVAESRTVNRDALREDQQRYYDLVVRVVEANPLFAVKPVQHPDLVALLRKHQFGYGLLEDYLAIDGLEDIWFNRYDQGFYYANGRKHRITQRVFRDEADMLDFIKRVANANGEEINTSRPSVDATLAGGQRLNAVLPPMAVDGPKFVVRSFGTGWRRVEDYIAQNVMSAQLAEDFGRWVRGKANIIVSGGTGAGKTSVLNCLINTFVEPSERVAILETNPEMLIDLPDKIPMVTREDAFRTKGGEDDLTMDVLIKQTLRQRPDRVIVGELRGREAYATLKAWNSGHGGSFCTVHADDAELAVNKLEQLCMEAEIGSEVSIQKQIGGSVDIIVQIQRLDDGRRRITQVFQVLTPSKYRQKDPRVVQRVKELFDAGQLTAYSPHIFLLPIYEHDEETDQLVKVNDVVPIKGKKLA